MLVPEVKPLLEANRQCNKHADERDDESGVRQGRCILRHVAIKTPLQGL